LAADATTELEKLLVDRITIAWIAVYYADLDLTRHLVERKGTTPSAQAAEKRLNRAQQRYLAAIKCLATVNKLLKPAPSAYDMLNRIVPETSVKLRNRGFSPASSVPVSN
jgi:hypothetical protein